MLIFLYFIIYSLYNVVFSASNFQVIVLPISKIAIKPNNRVELTIKSRSNKDDRLDIEPYDELIDIPDIDKQYCCDRDDAVRPPVIVRDNRINRSNSGDRLYSLLKNNKQKVEFTAPNSPEHKLYQTNKKRDDFYKILKRADTSVYTNYNNIDLKNNHRYKSYLSESYDTDDKGEANNPYYFDVQYNENPKQIFRDEDDPYVEDKIVGGFNVEINLYPYHVGYGTNCGGAIIANKWVITAGHCGSKPYIRVGSKYLNQGKKVNVKNHYVHPMWSARNKDHPFDYDFQLLELSEPLKFDDNVQSIKVAHIQDMVIGKVITVTGWGNTQENGPYSSLLRAVRVPIISKDHCQSVPFPYFRGSLTNRMFCAGFKEGKKDACQGDSGGPAVSHDRLLGMVSFGYGCATPGSYGVYSKVAKVRPWIEQITRMTLS